MTATTGSGTDPHPEVTEISDLTEGLLPPRRAAEVREHLTGCALCADVLASLTEIRDLLGTLPGPTRMPADVAGRIDAALAAEALLDATLPSQRVSRETSSSTHVPRETSPAVYRDPRPRKRRPGLLLAASVAGVALLTGALYEAASSGGGGSGGDDASSSMKKVEGSSAVPAAGPVADQVAAQVRQLLGKRVPASVGTPGKGGNSPMLDRGTTAAGGTDAASGVPSCVLKGTRQSQPLLTAERYLFRGTDSYLVVLSHPDDSSLVDAYVVNASCTASSPGVLLFRSTYPR
ncbi:hypothetical protein GA0115240_11959 [Streptomyces sp. DvalAA-14]|uniref:anti-sigma factor family protein n=1 Tax=unclassified Streptomyces TaxID=2593676 RepID=UPI00081BAB3A|nr:MULTISPECIES: zf-HC2 domain-containing protein [unclassified Streptomyces]MYS20392.1 hypothetical protein [Streptomyces sp. SID4948]SCD68030.1 hypothetical protein GA0115240_11959 [Streptomyces sp. DvalAA-14]